MHETLHSRLRADRELIHLATISVIHHELAHSVRLQSALATMLYLLKNQGLQGLYHLLEK